MSMVMEIERPSRSDAGWSVNHWYNNATVRHRPRIVVPDSSKDEIIFPRSRQVLIEHELVKAMGDSAINYILAQSAYRYMYEIGLLETQFVIDCSLNIVNDKIVGFNEEEKRDALTVVIDEGYHAYVALDFILQMKTVTEIEPIEVPKTNGNLIAVSQAMEILPDSMHMDFQLISVCLAEHTLTKDLVSIGKEKDATRTFTQVMIDHVADEGRHANYFATMMTKHWQMISEESRKTIGFILPNYLDEYLAGDADREFDAAVLRGLGMDEADIRRVIDDTHPAYMDKLNSYIAVTKANLVKLLGRCGVLEHAPTRAAFQNHGIAI